MVEGAKREKHRRTDVGGVGTEGVSILKKTDGPVEEG